jgi:GDP-L-fucose synthase
MSILITGGTGMLGSTLVKLAAQLGIRVLAPNRFELNLENSSQTLDYMNRTKPAAIIHTAAKVGGIAANVANPIEFLTQNIEIDRNLLKAAELSKIEKLIYVGSSCMYPMNLVTPMSEKKILSGSLEPTNEGYALAKIVGAKNVQYVAETKGFAWRSLVLSNLYGPHDHFEPDRSHLLAAIIGKISSVAETGSRKILMWGDGTVRREFTFVEDVASFMLNSINHLSKYPNLLNVGIGVDYSVREYYEMVIKAFNLDVEIVVDLSKPVGMQRKLLDVTEARKLGWNPQVGIELGIRRTVDWYLLKSKVNLPNE